MFFFTQTAFGTLCVIEPLNVITRNKRPLAKIAIKRQLARHTHHPSFASDLVPLRKIKMRSNFDPEITKRAVDFLITRKEIKKHYIQFVLRRVYSTNESRAIDFQPFTIWKWSSQMWCHSNTEIYFKFNSRPKVSTGQRAFY